MENLLIVKNGTADIDTVILVDSWDAFHETREKLDTTSELFVMQNTTLKLLVGVLTTNMLFIADSTTVELFEVCSDEY